MGASLILNIPELAQNQTQAYTVVNEMLAALEQAGNRRFIKSITSNTALDLTVSECNRAGYIRFDNSAFNPIVRFPRYSVPGGQAGDPDFVRLILVHVAGTAAIDLRNGANGASVLINPSEIVLLYVEGLSLVPLLRSSAGGGSNAFNIATFIAGPTPGSGEILRYVTTETLTFQDNFSGSRGTIGTNPTTALSFTVSRNGTSIGTIAVSSGGVFTFTTTGSTPEVFATGDVLTISSTASDATAANVAFTLRATR